jgi:thiosulfate dehydrogenase
MHRWLSILAIVIAVGLGVAIGYVQWGWPPNWYAYKDVSKLGAGAENDLIRYGAELIDDTPLHIGKDAADPALRYAGNNLACGDCHLLSGLKPYAAPFVSTFTSFPMLANDEVVTLAERINGCMTRSMNGRAMPKEGREMEAIIAYIRFLGTGSPEGLRVAGMGLKHLSPAEQAPDAGRGEQVYASHCVHCHKADGAGEKLLSPAIGYAIPPLWGDDSFNTAAGMSLLDTAAASIHATMPHGAAAGSALLSEQQAWDVARFITTRPRPPGPDELKSR